MNSAGVFRAELPWNAFGLGHKGSATCYTYSGSLLRWVTSKKKEVAWLNKLLWVHNRSKPTLINKKCSIYEGGIKVPGADKVVFSEYGRFVVEMPRVRGRLQGMCLHE